MEKRLIIAIALSIIVLMIWSGLAPKPQTPLPATKTEALQTTKSAIVEKTVAQTTQPEVEKLESFNFSFGKSEIVFTQQLATIRDIIFKEYKSHKFSPERGFLLAGKDLLFNQEKVLSNQVIFVHRDKDKQIIKDFRFSNLNYSIDLEIEIKNLSSSPLQIDIPILLGVLKFSGDQNEARFRLAEIALKDKILHLNAKKDSTFEDIKFVAIRDRYFVLLAEPQGFQCRVIIKKISPSESEVWLAPKETSLSPGALISEKFRIYLGPQDLQAINRINSNWAGVIYFGTFDFISHLLLQLLGIFYLLGHNWGLAIIILSIAVYVVLFPFSLKQMRSMKEMQILQPKIEALRKLYKDNPQRMNKEVMQLYREHKVNPLGGCLPMILQIPVFFALYQALMRSVALKGAHFLWIKDLSEPDKLFALPFSLPVLGNEVNILPILMTILMFFQQKSSMATGSATPESAQQQKIMLIIFPLLFGFIFYHMPSGLVLYWFINSALMLVFQLRLFKSK